MLIAIAGEGWCFAIDSVSSLAIVGALLAMDVPPRTRLAERRPALHELKETRTELREAKHDFGGHRQAALRDVNYAIEQLELALKFVRK